VGGPAHARELAYETRLSAMSNLMTHDAGGSARSSVEAEAMRMLNVPARNFSIKSSYRVIRRWYCSESMALLVPDFRCYCDHLLRLDAGMCPRFCI
jgi:hypothetical protein